MSPVLTRSAAAKAKNIIAYTVPVYSDYYVKGFDDEINPTKIADIPIPTTHDGWKNLMKQIETYITYLNTCAMNNQPIFCEKNLTLLLQYMDFLRTAEDHCWKKEHPCHMFRTWRDSSIKNYEYCKKIYLNLLHIYKLI